jgi:hypothetical protein
MGKLGNPRLNIWQQSCLPVREEFPNSQVLGGAQNAAPLFASNS